MQAKRAAGKNGLGHTNSEDRPSQEVLPLERQGDTRSCNDSQDVNRMTSSVAGGNSMEENGAVNVNASPVAMILSEEVEMQMHRMINSQLWHSLPGAHPVEGPRLAPRPQCLRRVSASIEERNIWALDPELVQEEIHHAEAATLNRSEPSTPSIKELVDATILPEVKTSTKSIKSKLLCLVIFFLMFAVVMLLTITTFLVPNKSPASSSSSGEHSKQQQQPSFPVFEETHASDASAYPPFQESLPKAVLHNIGDRNSPIYLANLWMLGDPNLNCYSFERQRQRFFLATLYHATNGDYWFHRDHWMSYNISECNWYSHSSLPMDSPYYLPDVCTMNETLTSLNLAENNLTGSLPLFPTLLLPQLRAFDMDDNRLGGALPPLFSGPNLEVIIISNNAFNGTWRTGDGIFDYKFKVVENSGNCFTTGYPDNQAYFLSLLQHTLEVANSSDNCFDGSVPTEIGLVTNMIYLGRGDSNIFGTLPSELGLLTDLQHMDFGGNINLNGTIPAELGGLTALTHLDIAGNAISGTIPMDLCARVKEGTLGIEANCSLLDCCV